MTSTISHIIINLTIIIFNNVIISLMLTMLFKLYGKSRGQLNFIHCFTKGFIILDCIAYYYYILNTAKYIQWLFSDPMSAFLYDYQKLSHSHIKRLQACIRLAADVFSLLFSYYLILRCEFFSYKIIIDKTIHLISMAHFTSVLSL